MTTIRQNIDSVEPRFLETLGFPVAVGGTSEPTTPHRSVELNVITGAQTWTDYQIMSVLLESERLSVANPSQAELNFPFIQRVGVGFNAIVDFTDRFGFKWRTQLPFGWVNSGSITLPSGFVEGSIPAHCLGLIEAERNGNDDVNYFSTINHSSQTYTPNENCWAAGWDFSGVAIWNSRSGSSARAGTAITRRHIWLAWHYRLRAGDTIRFRRPDGTVDTHTILAINPGNDAAPDLPLHEVVSVNDLCVAVLDRDLHESIAVYPLATWARNVISLRDTPPDPWIPGYGLGAWVPFESQSHVAHACLHLNRNRQVGVMVGATRQDGASWTAAQVSYAGETLPYRVVWMNYFSGRYSIQGEAMSGFTDDYENWVIAAVGGDSGCPVFCPTSATELAVASLFTDPFGGMLAHEETMNVLIRTADAAAGISTGLTVTVAPDPTITP